MNYKIENYVSDEGAQVRVMTPEEGEGEKKYIGAATIPGPDGNAFPIQFEINEAKTVSEAFDKFRECAEKHLEDLEKQMMEANKLTDARGNPIGAAAKDNKEPMIFTGK